MRPSPAAPKGNCFRLLHSVTPLLSIIDAFKGDKGAMALPNLAPNKFQERPSGASGMQERY